MIRVATDVGGTFTDLISYDDASGAVVFSKSLTTVDDQSIGVLDAIGMAEQSGLGVDGIGFFVHGGTTVINAITERKGVKTALVTTAGFRDVLEIGRGNRPDLYNLRTRTPAPFVPRHLRFEVRERMNASGQVLQALDEEDVARCARECREQDVAAVAIIFLHSYANPAHENNAPNSCARSSAGYRFVPVTKSRASGGNTNGPTRLRSTPMFNPSSGIISTVSMRRCKGSEYIAPIMRCNPTAASPASNRW